MSIKTWFADNASPNSWSARKRVIVSGILVVVLVGGGLGAAFALQPAPPVAAPGPTVTPLKTESPTPSPTPTPSPEPAVIERTATATGSVNGWTLADRTQLAGVLPQVGDAADGQVAISIDAPVVPAPRPAFAVTVPVQPSTVYTFNGSFRLATEDLAKAPASIHIGAATEALPDLNANWLDVEVAYETAADETSLTLTIVVDSAVRGLDADAFSLVSAAGENVLPNPSFEDVGADWGVRNDVLILQEQTAALAVSLGPGPATWVATGLDGAEVARGGAEVADGLSALPLDGLGQGYYNVKVTGSDGRSVTAPVGLVTMPTAHVPIDPRVGAHIHAQKDFNAEATIAAGALGMGMLRVGDNWQTTEPTPGQYAFSPNFSRAFAEADTRGMQKLLITGRTNTAYDGNMPPHSAGALDAYGRYVSALVQNFDLDAVEIYNEFNIKSFNKGFCNGHASCYAPILDVGHDAVKAIRPDLPVIGGVTGNYDGPWFDVLWQNGGLDNLDAMSFHPYQVYFDVDSLGSVVRSARKLAGSYGAEKPIWLTELGWTTKSGDVSYAEQANMVIRAEVTALGSGVERYLWYDLVNDETDRAEHEGNFGQFWQRWGGVAALPPKPAAFTQALMLAALDGKMTTGLEQLGAGVYSYPFSAEGKTVRYAWMHAGQSEVQYAADGPITVTSSNGAVQLLQPQDGKVTLTLSTSPVILTGDFSS